MNRENSYQPQDVGSFGKWDHKGVKQKFQLLHQHNICSGKEKICRKHGPPNSFYLWGVHFLYKVLYASLCILNVSWLKQMLSDIP